MRYELLADSLRLADGYGKVAWDSDHELPRALPVIKEMGEFSFVP